MEEGIRVTQVKAKSKKLQTILLVVTGILGLALVGTAIYFYTIKDTSSNVDNENTITCGCYYIDPKVSTECGDPRRAFKFELSTGTSTSTCKTTCSTSNLSANDLNSSTEQDLYQICQLQSIADTSCQSMTIKDKNGKIVTGEISSTDGLVIEATFDKEYTDYKFVINNESLDPDVVTPNKLTIQKTLNDLNSSTAINIVATGTTTDGEQINTPVCRRLIEVTKSTEANVTNLQLASRLASGVTKISSAKIATGALSSTSNVSIKFTFSDTVSGLTMTKGFTVDSTAGTIEIIEQDLYNTTNFSENRSFSALDTYDGSMTIQAEVFISTTSIGKASTSVEFSATEEDDDTGTNTTLSSFTVSNSANLQCVERVSPSNAIQYTIVVTNKSTTSQKITNITDKLPLGFAYTANSTKINSVTVTDSGYVATSSIGDTQQIVFSKTDGWTLSANQSLTIVFGATAGSETLSGANNNEVVVTPEQIPADPSTLRTSKSVTVAQDCDNITAEEEETPSTGIFDSTIAKVLIGLIVVLTGWFIYNKPQGKILVEKFVDSNLYKDTELNTWRIFKPKKYFEEVVVRKTQKRD